MKNILLVLFTIAFFCANAQDKIDKVADEICENLSDKDLSSITDMNSLSEVLGGVIMEVLSKKSKRELKKLDANIIDENSIRNFGVRVGAKIGATCEPFANLIRRLMGEKDSELLEIVKEQEGIESTKKFGDVLGKIIAINETEFLSISLQDEDGNQNNYYFLKEFEGSKEFIENLAAYNDKDVEISFVKYKVYNPASKSFKNIKEIKSISLE